MENTINILKKTVDELNRLGNIKFRLMEALDIMAPLANTRQPILSKHLKKAYNNIFKLYEIIITKDIYGRRKVIEKYSDKECAKLKNDIINLYYELRKSEN